VLAREGVRVRLVDESVDVIGVRAGASVHAFLRVGELRGECPALRALVVLVLVGDQPGDHEGARQEQEGQQTTQHCSVCRRAAEPA
jgi:hypothetical protein